MNRSDIIHAVANQCSVSQKDVAEVVDLFIDTIQLSLECGEDVLISGFGKFIIRERKSVNKTNPRTGAKMVIPAKRSFIFKPSATFKQDIIQITEMSNGNSEEDPRLEEDQGAAEIL